jgi:TonB-linked SusC/RagA family outer membrane protein
MKKVKTSSPGGIIKTLITVFTLLLTNFLHAQSTITGKVTDRSGVPLSNVSVMVKGKTTGTTTNAEGSFSIIASADEVLIFSSAEYDSHEARVSTSGAMSVQLDRRVSVLDDLVVVGYGTVRKKDLTGSVAVVNVDEARKTASYDVAKMLQGQAAGISVHGSGEPGGFVQIKIRGVSSFINNNPLFVIDGVPVTAPFDFSPDDIESIQVLKDASAGAIYGSRASTGVIIITTKKGRAGTLKVDYNGYAGLQKVPKKLPVTDAEGYRTITNAAELNAGLLIAPGNDPTSPSFIDDVNTDWQEEGFKTGVIQDHNIRFSGGSEANTYNVSLGYFNQSSTYRGPQNYRRFTVNAGMTGKKGIFSYGSKLMYTRSEKINPFNNMQFHAVFGGAVTSLITAIPTMPVFDPNRLRGYGGSDNATQRAITLNVIGMNALLKNTSDRNRLLGNFWGELQLVKNLRYRINLSYDRTDYDNFAFEPTYDLGWYYLNTQSYMFQQKGTDQTILMENTLSYNIKSGRHSIDVLAGTTYQRDKGENTTGSGTGLPEPYFYTFNSISNPANKTLTSGSARAVLLSYLGRLNYNFDDRYLLTVNFRRDGSSRFSKANRWGNFPSVAFAWNAHNEKFLKMTDLISSLKLRGGYGVLGNQDIGNYLYQSYINTNAGYVFGTTAVPGGVLAPGATTVTQVDPGIKWEEKTTINVAVDLGLMNDKLKFTAEYFNNKTVDLLAPIPIPLTIGSVPWEITTNAASVRNSGIEFTLQHTGTIGKVNFNISGNVYTLKNKVLKLGGTDLPIYGNVSKTEVGRSVGELYAYVMTGIFQSAGDVSSSPTQVNAGPGDVKFQDSDGNNMINDEDRVYLGRSIPNLYYGLNLSASYLQFDFSMFWQGSSGNKVYNGVYHDLMVSQYINHHVDALNFWTPSKTVVAECKGIYFRTEHHHYF